MKLYRVVNKNRHPNEGQWRMVIDNHLFNFDEQGICIPKGLDLDRLPFTSTLLRDKSLWELIEW